MERAVWLCLEVPMLASCTLSSLWRSRAGTTSRAKLEVQLGPHLVVFGLEAQVGLASRAPNTSEGITEEPKLCHIGVKHD